jgi:hypothetical protein
MHPRRDASGNDMPEVLVTALRIGILGTCRPLPAERHIQIERSAVKPLGADRRRRVAFDMPRRGHVLRGRPRLAQLLAHRAPPLRIGPERLGVRLLTGGRVHEPARRGSTFGVLRIACALDLGNGVFVGPPRHETVKSSPRRRSRSCWRCGGYWWRSASTPDRMGRRRRARGRGAAASAALPPSG